MTRLDGMILRDHRFDLPLDHDRPDGDTLRVFAREVVDEKRVGEELPWLVYLQGGPGFASPRPFDRSGWIKTALEEYRVLLLDQRGTGCSTQVGAPFLAQFGSARERAGVLKLFRADSIVKDLECIRRKLAGGGKWSLLGQSFGGFCAVHYLSAAPEGLREVFITGGLPSLTRPIDDVYRATYSVLRKKIGLFLERYPGDEKTIRCIEEKLASCDVRLPRGDRLTPRRFRQIGSALGASDGFEKIHYVLEEALVTGGELGESFLNQVDQMFPFSTNPIYAILHEACYLQGGASRWSAERMREDLLLTEEMIFPWMFDEVRVLGGMKEEAEILANDDEWPRLYDVGRLGENEVPCVAAIYENDMYVPRQYSEETAGAIRGLRTWITDEFEHNGLRADGEAVFGGLLDRLREK